MARSKLPLLSGISGKIGPYVAFMRDGKQFIREHTIPRDPKTPAQLAQRAKISLVNKGISPLNKVIKQNYPNNSGAYRSLVGKTIRECVVGAYPDLTIDYSRILLSEGEVLLPDHVTAAFQPDSGQITLNWDRELPPRSSRCLPDDLVNAVFLYTPKLGVLWSHLIAKRSEGTATVELHKGWDPSNTHCWIYFTTRDLAQHSNSLYVKL